MQSTTENGTISRKEKQNMASTAKLVSDWMKLLHQKGKQRETTCSTSPTHQSLTELK